MRARGDEQHELAECELVVAHYSGLLVYRIARDLILVGKFKKKNKKNSKNLEHGELVGVSLPP